MVFLYFQYTHFSNAELTTLRSFIMQDKGKVQLLSSKHFTKLNMPITFGKLLLVKIPTFTFSLSFIAALLTKFNVLHLLFIEYDSFILSPSLYSLYTQHSLTGISTSNLYCLSYCLSTIRLVLFRLRYVLASLYLSFQENLLLKINYTYIC